MEEKKLLRDIIIDNLYIVKKILNILKRLKIQKNILIIYILLKPKIKNIYKKILVVLTTILICY